MLGLARKFHIGKSRKTAVIFCSLIFEGVLNKDVEETIKPWGRGGGGEGRELSSLDLTPCQVFVCFFVINQ